MSWPPSRSSARPSGCSRGEVTELVHGVAATDAVIAASEALFGQGDLASLDAGTLDRRVAELPHASLPATTTVAQALVDTGLTSSLSEARRAIGQGGVYLNNVKVDDDAATLEGAALAGGRAVLRRGKKTLGRQSERDYAWATLPVPGVGFAFDAGRNGGRTAPAAEMGRHARDAAPICPIPGPHVT